MIRLGNTINDIHPHERLNFVKSIRIVVNIPVRRPMGCRFFIDPWLNFTQQTEVYICYIWNMLVHIRFNYIWSNYSDLTRPISPNGGLVREIPLFHGNLGW